MSELNIVQLIEMTEGGQEEEAAQVLADYVNSISPADRGKVYAGLMEAYLDLTIANQTDLMAIMDQQIQSLKELQKTERQLIEEVDLAQARNQLKS